ncbi:hypothetical protein NLI96_g4155 [Meripilus lineatus]|uniref:beta-glucosidase n=1 Tax=Meripilus lineatus TaxID=2056292 RepID=A0AAD5VAS3_9APHY|nr:hypothetical protein NLI96_g4155 [Physisporinus lineatus]
MALPKILWLALLGRIALGTVTDPTKLDACPGYKVTHAKSTASSLSADLILAGGACNVFGKDVSQLKLDVTYETNPSSERYEVPESVFPRPNSDHSATSRNADIRFNYTTSPFAFSIYRASTSEVLFSTASHPIIFEPQYLRVKTNLPSNANIYGLGEHTDTFRLPTHNYTRTMWSRDAYGVPSGTNLYGNHPVYFEHRTTGTHGVLLLNSNGMDIKIDDTGGTTLEYNVIGGILDFYFLSGSETDPTEVSRQYAEIVGKPAEVPYWSLGLHQCRFGYNNYIEVAGVISNYSAAQIPLETMWTDIDYMQRRKIFTVDPDYFPMPRMREIVSYLHSHDQRYVLMTDPAVAYLPDEGYGTLDRGTAEDIWLKAANGSTFLSIVWPGVTVFPDWFHPKAQEYWSKEFEMFYNPQTGIDIDGAWIDMNEPASFCTYPCDDPFQQARDQNLPPPRSTLPPDPNAPIFQTSSLRKRAIDHTGDDLQNPPYLINNAAATLSDRTAYTDAKHANGLIEYDTHNLYGTMMSVATHNAMLARRPGLRTLVITRSTFAGAGAKVGKWLGDNLSDWEHYRQSIAGILGMAGVYQVPMVGADICGFGEPLFDWSKSAFADNRAMLSRAGYNRDIHNQDTSISQEFYRWPSVAQAARNVLDIRYRLMDYIYTAMHQAHIDGSPVLEPLWYNYPNDPATFAIDLQFFYGKSILVSPVTDENSTSVSAYFPKDSFYDFQTLAPYAGQGSIVTLDNINFTSIPVHIRGGVVLPLREKGAMTTTELRKTDFEFVVAPGTDGSASGSLYIDDGISITPKTSTSVQMSFKNNHLTVSGKFGFPTSVKVARVRFLSVSRLPNSVKLNGKEVKKASIEHDGSREVLTVEIGVPLKQGFDLGFA